MTQSWFHLGNASANMQDSVTRTFIILKSITIYRPEVYHYINEQLGEL